jgi:hypothetical protein
MPARACFEFYSYLLVGIAHHIRWCDLSEYTFTLQVYTAELVNFISAD